MLALHAVWSSLRLLVFAEDPDRLVPAKRGRSTTKGRRSKKASDSSRSTIREHPFAAVAGQLSELDLPGIGDAEPTTATLLLPSAPSRPFASPTLARLTRPPRSGARPRLRPWRVPALSLDPDPALDLLIALPDGAGSMGSAPAIGDSLHWAARAAETALDLAARGRIVPALVEARDDGPPAARWVPAPAGPDRWRRATRPRTS